MIGILKSAGTLLLSILMASIAVGLIWACVQGHCSSGGAAPIMIVVLGSVVGWPAFIAYLVIYILAKLDERKSYLSCLLGLAVCSINAAVFYYVAPNAVRDANKLNYTLTWSAVGSASGLIHGRFFGKKTYKYPSDSDFEENYDA